MNNRNGHLNGTPRNFKAPQGHVPPVLRDNYSNVIVGGSCDGCRAETDQASKVVTLQKPPPDLVQPARSSRIEVAKVVELPDPENYRWARIDTVNGKALNPQKILVDLVDRFWFRVPVDMSDGDAIKLLVSNYSTTPEEG